MNPPTLPPHLQLIQMISGYWVSQSIHVAAKLNIADRLGTEPQHCDTLAAIAHCDPEALYRLLRGLASVGIFTETSPRTFGLTPLGELLRRDHPRSLQPTAIMMGEAEHYQSWGHLLHSVQTGKPAFDHCFGEGIFSYFGSHPEAAQIFEDCMSSFSAQEEPEILKIYDFSPFKTVVDVGGGYGELLGTILAQYPQVQGILFDEGYVTERAAATLARHGVSDRCGVVAGSFFEGVPPGGDLYILKHIIHDWGDGQAITILKNCRAQLSETGRLVLFEQVVPPGNVPGAAKFLDLNMLVMCPGGKERTEEEFEGLFAAAGLRLLRIIPSGEDIWAIEGCKA